MGRGVGPDPRGGTGRLAVDRVVERVDLPLGEGYVVRSVNHRVKRLTFRNPGAGSEAGRGAATAGAEDVLGSHVVVALVGVIHTGRGGHTGGCGDRVRTRVSERNGGMTVILVRRALNGPLDSGGHLTTVWRSPLFEYGGNP